MFSDLGQDGTVASMNRERGKELCAHKTIVSPVAVIEDFGSL